MPSLKTGAFRRAGAGRSRPDRFGRHTPATSDEPERKIKLPGVPHGGGSMQPAGTELRPRQASANTGLREVCITPALN
jgi:hypothetical protein